MRTETMAPREPKQLAATAAHAPGWWMWSETSCDLSDPEAGPHHVDPDWMDRMATDPRGVAVGWDRSWGVVADVAFPTREVALDALSKSTTEVTP